MAYNILKDDVEFSGVNLGNIEDMVDDHSNQTIGGTKTFSQMVTASSGLSASAFYGDGSALSGYLMVHRLQLRAMSLLPSTCRLQHSMATVIRLETLDLQA